MSIPNPYARDQERAAALASAVPALEALAAEYWAIGRRLCIAVTAAHFADFRTADETFTEFVEMGKALKAEGLTGRVENSMKARYEAMGYQTSGWDGTTERQKACWGLSEMISAGVSGDRLRFDSAYSTVIPDPDAEPHVRPLFRVAGGVWMSWLYCPHVEGFRARATAILTPVGWSLSYDTLRRFPSPLSEEGVAALGTWVEWGIAPGEVRPMSRSESGPGVGFPLCPKVSPPGEATDRSPSDGESDRPADQTDTADRLPNSVVRLTDRQKHLLRELLDIGAIGSGKKTTRDAVAKRLNKSKTGDDYGRDFAALSQAKFTDSQQGPDGGIWLTSKGKEAAMRLRDECSQS